MDRLLIATLSTLVFFNYTGLASLIYFICLSSGFVSTTYATLSTFTALSIYYRYGMMGLLMMIGSTLSMVCAGSMYWFDMTLEDLRAKANAANANIKEGDEIRSSDQISNDASQTVNALSTMFHEKTGIELDTVKQNWYEKYSRVSATFDSLTTRVHSIIQKFREITYEAPGFSLIYFYYDAVYAKVIETVDSLSSMKEMSRINREMNENTMKSMQDSFAALTSNMSGGTRQTGQQENVLGAFASGSGLDAQNFPDMASMFGNFDMAKMAELEKAMTPEQRRATEEAAMNMLENMNAGQFGDLMQMFGQSGLGQNGQSLGQMPNLNRKTIRRMKRK